jgi:hypothetical protein
MVCKKEKKIKIVSQEDSVYYITQINIKFVVQYG